MKNLLLPLALLTALSSPISAVDFKLGTARRDVSPTEPIRLAGYAVRKNPSEGVAQKLWVKAIALEQTGGEKALLLSVDNCGLTEELREKLVTDLKDQGLTSQSIVIFNSHTHSAPCLANALANLFVAPIPDDQQKVINSYTENVSQKMKEVSIEALGNLRPVKLHWTEGRASFAKNRRTAGGPVDHALPLLLARDANDKIVAALANYACHCTTLGGEFNQAHGDWAGVAQELIEKNNPGALGMIAIGCGADANPHPRGEVAHAEAHGQELATEVQRLLAGPSIELTDRLEMRSQYIWLPFDPHPTKAQWEARAKEQGIVGYHAQRNLEKLARGEKLPAGLGYLIQTWNFGPRLGMVFLPGEVVVDYALRLKTEFDARRLWISGYANYVPCYIPSVRILQEGGYEAEHSLWYYDQPARLSTRTEEMIIKTVHGLLPASFKPDPKVNELPPPRTPHEALATFQTQSGFKVELVAAEPLVESPVAIDWDAEGRLLVAEMRDFPLGMDGQFGPGGRVKLLTDTNADGIYDKSSVFMEDLPFPTGVTAFQDSVFISAAPDIWLAKDADGDGRADNPKKIYSGFATENYQARVNSIVLGLDGWMYGANGLIGGEISRPGHSGHVNISGRDFRFRTTDWTFETASGLTQHGRARDDWGHWFGCDNSTWIWHYPLSEESLRRNPRFVPPATRASIASGEEPGRVYPISYTIERFNDPHMANRVTSACGLEIYRARALGADFYGNAFVAEPVHNLVRRMVLAPQGASFTATRAFGEGQSEFLSSHDNWFRPVQIRTGPDGALYVVDMYRFVVEHPRWIPKDRLARLDLRAGADRGRIYRIVRTGTQPNKIQNLRQLSQPELTAQLQSEVGTERDRVQIEMLRRNDSSATEMLSRLATSATNPAVRVQALSTLLWTGNVTAPLAAQAVADTHPEVQRFGLLLAEKFPNDAALRTRVLALRPTNPAVRLQLALTLGKWPEIGEAFTWLVPAANTDSWLRTAMLTSAETHAIPLLNASTGHEQFTEALCETLLRSHDDELARAALDPVLAGEGGWRFRLLAELLENGRGGIINQPALEALARAKILQATRDAAAPNALRLMAAALVEARFSPPEMVDRLRKIAAAGRSELRPRAIRALLDYDETYTTDLLARWTTFSPADRQLYIESFVESRPRLPQFMQSLGQSIALTEVPLSVRQRLLNHPSPEIKTRATQLFAPAAKVDLSRHEEVLRTLGSPRAGQEVFVKSCASCHHYRGVGSAVGPNLAAITDRSTPFLLEAIVSPNSAVETRYLAYNVETKNGESHYGVVTDETATSLVLVNATAQRTPLLRSDLESIQASNVSLMPEGFGEILKPQELADLIAYLQEKETVAVK